MNINKVKTQSTVNGSSNTYYWRSPHYSNVQQGWECPRCGCINAPWVSQCNCNNDYKITCTSDHVTINPDWYKQVTGDQSEVDNILNNPVKYKVEEIGGSDYFDTTTSTWSNVSKNQSNTIVTDSVDKIYKILKE